MHNALPVVLGTLLLAVGCSGGEDPVTLEEPAARVSYSIGYQVGGDFRRQGVDLDPELVLRGIQDALGGSGSLLTAAEMRSALVALQQRVGAAGQPEQGGRRATDEAQGADAAGAFLAKNAAEAGVETLPSGLQYRVLQDGDGKSPRATDSVTVHYRGSLIDGTEFDSSYRRGKPATFAVNRVIAGWTEALQLMQEGAKWQLFIPPALAYGERGAGDRIPPNSALIFEVELIAVN